MDAWRSRELWAALATALAAGVHVGVTPEHFQESAWVGALFLAAAFAQAVLALLLITRGIQRPPWPEARRRVCLAGVALNGALVLVWLASRTVGLPGVGTEPVGLVDAGTKVAEVVAIVLLSSLARRRRGGASANPWPT